MNYYILNGKITDAESNIFGLGSRSPNIQGSLAKYVAQVQFNSELENSVRVTIEVFTDLILSYFPGANQDVQAAQRDRDN